MTLASPNSRCLRATGSSLANHPSTPSAMGCEARQTYEWHCEYICYPRMPLNLSPTIVLPGEGLVALR
jgi:hypothetical protein